MKSILRSRLVIVGLFLGSLLAACGDPTAAPASTTTAITVQTTVVAATPVATTVSQVKAFSIQFVLKFENKADPLNVAAGVVVDAQGRLYVADRGNSRIQIFDKDGKLLSILGSKGSGEGQFMAPAGLVRDKQGNLYVTDRESGFVQKFDPNGKFLARWGGKGTGEGQFADPLGIAVDDQENVFVSDFTSNYLTKFDSSGKFLAKWGGSGNQDGQFNGASQVALDKQGNVFVVDRGGYRVEQFDSTGKFITKWGSQGNGPGQFMVTPNGIAVDLQGNVYVCGGKAQSANQLLKFDNNGKFLGSWGGDSYGSGDGQFDGINWIALDNQNNLYISEAFNNRVQKFRQG